MNRSFLHCRGIGPVRLAQLNAAGIETWTDAVERPDRIPEAVRDEVVAEAQRCLAAEAKGDLAYLVGRFAPPDRGRILERYLSQVTFFDLETTGLEIDAAVTVIGCYHRGQLRTFVEHEDLDEFLTLLDDVTLLASFNGSSFDVPRLLGAFHIPALPCPHLDLRWVLHHAGHRGSQAVIERALGETRPKDVGDIDGARAVELWQDWQDDGDAAARQALLRYCGADVLSMVRLAHRVSGQEPPDAESLWKQLPDRPEYPAPRPAPPEVRRTARRQVAALRARLGPGKFRG